MCQQVEHDPGRFIASVISISQTGDQYQRGLLNPEVFNSMCVVSTSNQQMNRLKEVYSRLGDDDKTAFIRGIGKLLPFSIQVFRSIVNAEDSGEEYSYLILEAFEVFNQDTLPDILVPGNSVDEMTRELINRYNALIDKYTEEMDRVYNRYRELENERTENQRALVNKKREINEAVRERGDDLARIDEEIAQLEGELQKLDTENENKRIERDEKRNRYETIQNVQQQLEGELRTIDGMLSSFTRYQDNFGSARLEFPDGRPVRDEIERCKRVLQELRELMPRDQADD